MSARIIRALTLPEIETLLGWAKAEGWNPGLADATAFQAADPAGFIGAFVGGAMVAAISAVAYDSAFGFIGLYICHPDWRGQGHGKAAWDAGMAHLGDRTIGLDGVPEQQANYASMGFVAAYQSVRMTGMARAQSAPPRDLVSLDTHAVSLLRALDRQCFAADRDGFLSEWLKPPNRGVALLEGDTVTSYAAIRPCVDGHKIGPLFAATAADAETLFAALGAAAGGTLQIDVPRLQPGFLAALTELGFTPGFTTARMYRGQPPDIDMSRVFGITSLELG